MPELTNIEKTLLVDLEHQAESLENGCKGNMDVMCSVLAKTAKVVVAMARTGARSPSECLAIQARCWERVESRIKASDWKAKMAIWVPLSAAILGIGWKIISP